jgi:hypothetical protein
MAEITIKINVDGVIDLDKITEAILVEIERKKKEDKWAKIGRKPSEFNVGDIVLYGSNEYVRVTRVTDTNIFFFNKARKESGYEDTDSYAPKSYFKLITPVEARFDL